MGEELTVGEGRSVLWGNVEYIPMVMVHVYTYLDLPHQLSRPTASLGLLPPS